MDNHFGNSLLVLHRPSSLAPICIATIFWASFLGVFFIEMGQWLDVPMPILFVVLTILYLGHAPNSQSPNSIVLREPIEPPVHGWRPSELSH